jgi:hypothetical protein
VEARRARTVGADEDGEEVIPHAHLRGADGLALKRVRLLVGAASTSPTLSYIFMLY